MVALTMDVKEMHVSRRVAWLLAALVTLAASACAPAPGLDFVPAGDSYGAEELPQALEESDPGATARVAVTDAQQVRQDVLAELRTNGQDAGSLADLLTTEFPTDVDAVPYRVEAGSYEGDDAWIVYEAWGEPEGELTYRRIWVFARDDGAVLAAHSIR